MRSKAFLGSDFTVNMTKSQLPGSEIQRASFVNTIITAGFSPNLHAKISSSNFYTMDARRKMRPDISQLPHTFAAHVFLAITVVNIS